MKKVLVFGSFDVLHEGHRNLFAQAKKHGDHLSVVVARDETYRNLRGMPPLHDEQTRLETVQSESLVDAAVLGNHGDPYRIVRELRPDIIALGYDQTSFVDELEDKLASFKMQTTVLRMNEHNPLKYKSSILKKALGLLKVQQQKKK